ncbi:MAG TPA: DMT family transporter [Polyangiaceae bacterium]|nr:DMT family transporter [Polyangiaceae bacterium]
MSEPAPYPAVRPFYPVLVLLCSSVAWGLTWLPLKYFGRFGLLGVNVTLIGHGSVGVLALLWLARSFRAWRPDLRSMLLLSALGGLANLSFASAIVSGDVLRVMVLFYLLPAWSVVGGWLLLGERVDTVRKLTVLGALSGAFLILGGPHVLTQRPSFADALGVLAGFALALNNIFFRKLSHVAVSNKVASMFAGCLIWAVPLTLLGVQPLPSGVPLGVWLELVAFGLLWLFIATVGTQWGVSHMEAGRSSVLIIMELVTAVASAALINGTQLRPIEWVGGSLIVSAAFVEARRPVEG